MSLRPTLAAPSPSPSPSLSISFNDIPLSTPRPTLVQGPVLAALAEPVTPRALSLSACSSPSPPGSACSSTLVPGPVPTPPSSACSSPPNSARSSPGRVSSPDAADDSGAGPSSVDSAVSKGATSPLRRLTRKFGSLFIKAPPISVPGLGPVSSGSLARVRSEENLLALGSPSATPVLALVPMSPLVQGPVPLSTTPPSILFTEDVFYRCDIGGGVSVVRVAVSHSGSFESGGAGPCTSADAGSAATLALVSTPVSQATLTGSIPAAAYAEPPAWLFAHLAKRGRALCADACAECVRRGPLVVVAPRNKRYGTGPRTSVGARNLYAEASALAPCLRVPLVRALLARYEPRHECVVALLARDGSGLWTSVDPRLVCEPFICSVSRYK